MKKRLVAAGLLGLSLFAGCAKNYTVTAPQSAGSGGGNQQQQQMAVSPGGGGGGQQQQEPHHHDSSGPAVFVYHPVDKGDSW